MKTKINSRLIGIAILAIITTVIGVTVIYYNLFKQQVRSELEVSAKLLKDTHFFESIDIDTEKIDLSTDIEELRVTWISADGTVLYDNDVTTQTLENHLDRPEIRDAFESGVGESVRKSDTMDKSTYYYAVLLDNKTVLRVATDTESLLAVFISVIPLLSIIIFMITAICIGLSHMLTKQLIRPIEMMAENLETSDYASPYKELNPFSEKLRIQHTDVLSAAKARQDFTANVSHELKTPLTAISGYAELLEGDMVEDGQRKHFYQEIRKNADRLLALINDIIRLSELDRKGHTPVFEDIDLYATMQECAETLSVNAAQRNININFEGESRYVFGNKDMLKELIENLAQNAIRYNNPGGNVTVFAGERNDETVLMVKDDGIGIPPSEQERVFERFYRVDKSRSKETGGTGLGLAIVKHIAELHDARIELDSAPMEGTVVTVVF
ncbi:MAG: two-component sensor histidine kinase [Lachnospiraceae bacterium]|nr:two-component sensor histidine kinase [Lachnospiraceae bacterium]